MTKPPTDATTTSELISLYQTARRAPARTARIVTESDR